MRTDDRYSTIGPRPDDYAVEYTNDALWDEALAVAGGEPSAVDPTDEYAVRGFFTEGAARRFLHRQTRGKLYRVVDLTARDIGEGLVEWEWSEELVEEFN